MNLLLNQMVVLKLCRLNGELNTCYFSIENFTQMDDKKVVGLIQINKHKCNKGINLLNKIFSTIIKQPSDKSKQNINANRMSKKLNNCETCMNLLFHAGFQLSQDRQRLIFHQSKFNALKNTYQKLQQCSSSQVQKHNKHKLLQKLINMGFDEVAAINALTTSNGDLLKAIEYLIVIDSRYMDNNTCATNIDIQEMCDGDLSKCEYLITLKQLLDGYTKCSTVANDSVVISCLDMFLHLLLDHVLSDKDFESIHHKLGGFCDFKQCSSFRRHYTRRNVQTNDNTSPYQAIMDKIHCYFIHCYDLGTRLSCKDMKILRSVKVDESDDNYGLFNQQSSRLIEIVASKRHERNKVYKLDVQSPNNRYTRGFVNKNIIIQTSAQQQNNYEIYQYGIRFRYSKINLPSHCSKLSEKFAKHLQPNVSYKYKNLKEEILHNMLCRLNVDQYKHELTTASLYQNSYSGRKYIVSHCRYDAYDTKTIMGTNHILSVLFYCNYDALEYEFSKTYRSTNSAKSVEEIINDHRNFYWFGKLLKEAVLCYGVRDHPKDDYDYAYSAAFYHGINGKFLLPFVRYNAIQLNGPVSTSKSFAVAVNFTLGNDGMVVQFVDTTEPIDRDSNERNYPGHFFPCFWLSDYPAEQECLFIQGSPKFDIANIIHTRGVEYGHILDAFRVIDSILSNNKHIDHKEFVNHSSYRLSIRIIEHILAVKHSNSAFREFKSLDNYSRQMIDHWVGTACEHIDFVELQWNDHETNKWMNVDCLNILRPNVGKIIFRNFDTYQTVSMMNNIYEHLSSIKTNLEKIEIYSCNELEFKTNKYWVQQTIMENHETFMKIGFDVRSDHIYPRVCIQPAIQSVTGILDHILCWSKFNHKYSSESLLKPMQQLINQLIYKQISKQENYVVVDDMVHQFDEYCSKKIQLTINWSLMISRKHLFLYELLCHDCDDHEWINLNILSILFPNVVDILVQNVHWNKSILKRILLLLKGCKLNSFEMVISSNNTALTSAMRKYQVEFKQMQFHLKHYVYTDKDIVAIQRFGTKSIVDESACSEVCY
eukprot:304492_1